MCLCVCVCLRVCVCACVCLCVCARAVQRRGDDSMTFTDISLPNYDPCSHGGVTYEDAMKVMHVVKGGHVITGVDSFKVMYQAVGLGWIVKVLENARVNMLANRVYGVWANLRLPMSGRPSLQVLLKRRAVQQATCGVKECDKGR